MFCEDTAFLLYLEAKKIGNTSVMELMIPRIMKFFLTLVSSKDFLELSVDELCIILKSNYICVHCEMEVFMSAVRWLMYNWEHRKKSLLEVMSCIRFGLVAPWQLVDIRRNPENPEFIEISSTSHVQQLIEDGLAFAIIKYWYGNQTQDYYHWIDLLGLTEPTPRNWLEEDKNYVTYRDFLRDLNVYRRTQMLEKKRSKTNKIRQFRGLESQALPSMAQRPMLPPDGSTIQSRPLGMLPPNLAALIPPSPHHQNSEVHKQQGEPPPPTVTQYLNCRDYVNKYPSSECTQRNSHTYPCRGEGDTEDYEETVTEMRSDDEVGVTLGSTDLEKQAQEVLRAQEKRKMAETDNKGMEQDKKPYPKKQEQHASYREVSTDSVEMREYLTTDSSGNNMNLLSKAQNPAPALLRNPISASTIGLNTRSYLSEGSLFFADRESILVFGGIDPHSKYGMGRNKGIDIYRYLPDANTWEFIGELPEPRHHHSVAFFKGRVFLVGGADPRDDEERGKSIVVNTVWSYEPVTRSWFRETDMLSPRKNFGLVATNGKLFAIGGMDRQGRVLSSVERFDPVTGDWEEVAPLETGRMGLAATKFRDFIWVAGGMTACKKRPLSRNVERYDPQHNILYRMLERVARPQILIIGGVTTVYMRALSNVECFCCQRGIWIKGISNLPTTLTGHGSIALPPSSLI
ncbi:hypothetical protein C0J52_19160 [Blattella germanica]|nr:hypothetical protein C0J52_19160 [Blattella germanica]